jgi:precorrin-2 dehydrogenase / sirohydrochlorin ferrochelatase
VRFYPIMLTLEGRRAVVVGGGNVASRKVAGLLESGARVVVISPELEEVLKGLISEGHVEWIPQAFDESLLDEYPDAALIFGATNRNEVNVRIYEAAAKRKIPCNIADVPSLCTFAVPAVITQGDLLIAVSTGGSSPALARRIRQELEQHFGPEYAELTKLMGELRKQILAMGSSSDENKKLFRAIVNSEVLAALRANDKDRAFEILRGLVPGEVDLAAAME